MGKSFSENIVFMDTEFTHLDSKKGELLSIGLIKYTGEELYIEFEYSIEPHPWVVEHVLPTLSGVKVPNDKAIEMIREFIGSGQPYLMAYVNQFDAMYWYGLFGDPKSHPAFWIPIDFASILFAHGYDPNSMGKDSFFEKFGVDKKSYHLHNALDDTRLLRDVYLKFCTQLGN